MERKSSRVCVTGGAGYIASWLVKKLLHKGHTVHATFRNLGDQSKVGLLKGFPGAENRLVLFEADIYDAEKFEMAIQGCEFVFLVATPLQHQHAAQNSSKSAILGMHSIVSRPRVVDRRIVPRPLMYVELTYDHRLIDGREAVPFLFRIKNVVKNPRMLLLNL